MPPTCLVHQAAGRECKTAQLHGIGPVEGACDALPFVIVRPRTDRRASPPSSRAGGRHGAGSRINHPLPAPERQPPSIPFRAPLSLRRGATGDGQQGRDADPVPSWRVASSSVSVIRSACRPVAPMHPRRFALLLRWTPLLMPLIERPSVTRGQVGRRMNTFRVNPHAAGHLHGPAGPSSRRASLLGPGWKGRPCDSWYSCMFRFTPAANVLLRPRSSSQ